MRYKSNLFIPGHTLDRLDRGLNSNASALIIDLEDGCPDDKKIDAREELIGLLKKGMCLQNLCLSESTTL